MKQTPTIPEFWSSLFAQTQVTYMTFILLTLQIFTKLKTTFGRNLLYWMLSFFHKGLKHDRDILGNLVHVRFLCLQINFTLNF
jgi:hypothetical protein